MLSIIKSKGKKAKKYVVLHTYKNYAIQLLKKEKKVSQKKTEMKNGVNWEMRMGKVFIIHKHGKMYKFLFYRHLRSFAILYNFLLFHFVFFFAIFIFRLHLYLFVWFRSFGVSSVQFFRFLSCFLHVYVNIFHVCELCENENVLCINSTNFTWLFIYDFCSILKFRIFPSFVWRFTWKYASIWYSTHIQPYHLQLQGNKTAANHLAKTFTYLS